MMVEKLEMIDWESQRENCGFLIRNVLSEQNFSLPHRPQAYQKILIITWVWAMLVIVQAYSGNLTAMQAKPKLQTPIWTLQELVNQDEISWVIEQDTLVDFYMKTSQPGTMMNQLYNGATLVPRLSFEEKSRYFCYAGKERESGKIGSVCEVGEILPMFAKDFSKTGKCNFYLMEETFLSSIYAMAFQV